MRDLGVLTDCEIFSDPDFVIIVQRKWKMDIFDYIGKHSRPKNLFRNIEENVALFMKTICPKLKIMHDNGIIFSDIKPGNLVMEYDEKTNKAIEFGMIDWESVKKLDDECKMRHIGSYYYKPPEGVAFDEVFKLTTKYDVYCLGLSLLEMITLEHPLDLRPDEDDKNKKEPIKQDEIDFIMRYSQTLKKERNLQFKDLLLKMTCTSLDDRYDLKQVMDHPWYKQYCG